MHDYHFGKKKFYKCAVFIQMHENELLLLLDQTKLVQCAVK